MTRVVNRLRQNFLFGGGTQACGQVNATSDLVESGLREFYRMNYYRIRMISLVLDSCCILDFTNRSDQMMVL
jgi:hypothetical protein